MSGNPFRLMERVDGDFTVNKEETKIFVNDDTEIKLKWHSDEYEESLTLNEILEQVKAQLPPDKDSPFIRVWYESGMWGVIFETGNYKELGDKWIVHGITKGYA